MIDWDQRHSIPYAGTADFTITQTAPAWSRIPIEDENLLGKLATVPENGKVAITDFGYDTFGEISEIPAEALQIMKDKKLQVTLELEHNLEVCFQGSDLQESDIRNLSLPLGVSSLQRDLYFGAEVDALWYSVSFTDVPAIGFPFDLRIAEGDVEFTEAAKNSSVRWSSVNNDASKATLIMDNLQVVDGFVKIPFPNGYKQTDGARFAISTGTEKLASKPLTVIAEPQFSSPNVVRGTGFKTNITVTNENAEAIQDVVVMGTALDRLTNQEILKDITYQYTSADAGVTFVDQGTAEAGAYIEALQPGQTVTITAEVSVAEECASEAIQMMFAAASVGDNSEELLAWGEDYLNIILVNPAIAMKGDITLDGTVDMEDLLYMLKVVAGRIGTETLSAEQIYAGDVSGADSNVSMEDLLMLLKYVSGRITSLE